MPLYKKINKNNIKSKIRFKEFSNYWKWVTGDTLFKSVSNKNHNSELPVLAITQDFGAIPREMIDFNISVTNQSVASYKIVEKGDFIISLRSFQGGIELSEYKGICSPAYIILKPKKEINEGYFKFYLKTNNYIKNLTQNLEGIRDGKMISYKYFSEVGLILPSLPEQQKIANFLTAIDSRLQSLEKKKSLLEQYKKGVLQQIFKQEIRFKDEEGEVFPKWRKCQLIEIADRVKTKNKIDNQNVLTISAQLGLVSQLEYFNKSVSAKNLTGYYLLEKDDFAYNKSYSNGYPMGAIKRLNKYDFGVVSTLYICFRFNEKVSLDFMEQYFETGLQNKEIEKVAQEGARNHGLLNIGVNDFFEIDLKIPCVKEQVKIANFLSAIDKKIDLVNEQIEKTKTYKKGLLQQMFV